MQVDLAIFIAVLSSVLTLLVKIIFDWLKTRGNGNGNGHCAYKTDHDAQLKHNLEEMMILKRLFDNVVENQELLREILNEIRTKK